MAGLAQLAALLELATQRVAAVPYPKRYHSAPPLPPPLCAPLRSSVTLSLKDCLSCVYHVETNYSNLNSTTAYACASYCQAAASSE